MKTVFASLLALFFTSGLWAQVPVLYYDFEVNNSRTTAEGTPEQAVYGTTSTLYRSAYTGLTFMGTAGAGANYGGSAGTGVTANKWNTSSVDPGTGASEFFLFSTPTTGFTGLTLSFDALKNANGSPNKVGVTWSTDSLSFFSAATAAQTVTTTYTNLKFTLPSGAENKAKLYLRIYAYDATNNNTYLSIDNLTLSATVLSASNTLLDYPALGLSLASGTAYEPTYTNLSVSGTGTLASLGGNLKLGGTLALTAGTLALAGNTLTLGGTTTQGTGSINAAAGTVVFNGAAAQTLAPGLFAGSTVNNLSISNAAGVTVTGNLTVGNTLSLTAGTVSLGTATLNIGGSVQRSAGLLNATAATVQFNGTAAQSITAGVFSGSVKNLTVANNAGVSTAADATITGTLSLTAGTYDIGTTTQTLQGTLTRTAGTIEASLGSLILNGTAAQTIPAGAVATAIQNLTVKNDFGLTINDNLTVKATLVLQNGALNLNDKTLTLGGTVSGAGLFKGSSKSGITIAAAATAGTLNFDQATDGVSNALATLQVSSGGATLGNRLNLYTALNVAGGMLDLGGQSLVLKSTQTQTAYVAEIKGTLKGETNVTVERYIPAWSSRRYRLLTAPVSGTTINAAWQEGGTWNGGSTLPASGYGTLITGQQQGNAAAANAAGFDFWSAIANSSSSIRSFVPGTGVLQGAWQSLSSTLTPGAFDNQQAYLLFIRGDRSLSSGTTPGATVLRATGTLKKGNYLVTVPVNQNFTLIGNPYASPIDFKQIYDANSTKILSSFYCWQSSLGTGTGGYVLVRPVSAGSSLYETIPGNGTGSVANRLIHPGEGFFVAPSPMASSTNQINIQESNKSTTTPAISVFREMDPQLPAKLYVNLTTANDSAKILLDGVLAQYATTATQESSVIKSSNAGENLAIAKNVTDVIVTTNNIPSNQDTLQLRLWNTATKNYQLEIKGMNFQANGITAVLQDRYLNTEKPVLLNDSLVTYGFSINSDPASKEQSRFRLVLKTAQILPLLITGIKAEETTANTVNIRWQIADENGVQAYGLEKSTDGIQFTQLAVLPARKGTGEQEYSDIDSKPDLINYYRVKIIAGTNGAKYSAIVKWQRKTETETMSIYPNPVTGSLMNLQMSGLPAGLYELTLYNNAGQVVLQHSSRHNGGSSSEAIPVAPNLAAGQYRLEVKNQQKKYKSVNISVLH